MGDIADILNSLFQVYEPKEDITKLRKIQGKEHVIEQQVRDQEFELNKIIAGLKQKIINTQSATERPEPKSEHLKRMELLKREIQHIEHNFVNLETQHRDLQDKLKRVEQELSQLEETKNSSFIKYETECNEMKNKTYLAKYVAPITWNQKSLSQDSTHLKGIFEFENDVESFDVDTSSGNSYQITKQFWQHLYQCNA